MDGWPLVPPRCSAIGEAVRGAGFQDRPVAAAAQRLQPARRDHHVGEAAIAGALLDLLDRRFGVFQRDLHAGLQARFAIAPDLRFPLVRRGRHRRAELDVALVAAAAEQRHHQAVRDVEQIEQLLLHHLQVGAGMRAILRIRVHAHAGERRHARIVRRIGERRTRAAADRRAMLAPALRQELIQVGRRLRVGVHVAIDDAELASATDVSAWRSMTVTFIGCSPCSRGQSGIGLQRDCRPGSCAADARASRPAARPCRRSASADSRSRTAASRPSRSPR